MNTYVLFRLTAILPPVATPGMRDIPEKLHFERLTPEIQAESLAHLAKQLDCNPDDWPCEPVEEVLSPLDVGDIAVQIEQADAIGFFLAPHGWEPLGPIPELRPRLAEEHPDDFVADHVFHRSEP